MWAYAQRDGRPRNIGCALCSKWRGAKGKSIPCTTPQSLTDAHCSMQCRAVTLPIEENPRLGRKVNFAPGRILLGTTAQSRTSCKVWLTSGERCRCSNDAKTRNPLKFVGVPETAERISAITKPKFTILWGHVEELLTFKTTFPIVDTCLSCEDIAGQICAMVRRWRFLRRFCVLYFQRAARSTFQTCILNSH